MSMVFRRFAVHRWIMLAFGMVGILFVAAAALDHELWPMAVIGGWLIGAFHMWDALSVELQDEVKPDAIPPPDAYI